MSEILTQDEIDALIEGFASSGTIGRNKEGDRRAVRPYSFAEATRLQGAVLAQLRQSHGRAGMYAADALAAYLGQRVRLELQSVEEVDEGIFFAAMPGEAALVRFRPRSVDRACFLGCDAAIAFALLHASLGGEGEADSHDHEWTGLEASVLSTVAEILLTRLSPVWGPVFDDGVEIAAVRRSLADQEARSMCDGLVCIAAFSAEVAQARGQLAVCVPSECVEAGSPSASAGPEALDERIEDVPMRLVAVLGQAVMTLRELSSLRIGDTVVLDTKRTGCISIMAAGGPFLRGVPGLSDGRLAVRVTGPAGRHRRSPRALDSRPRQGRGRTQDA